MTIDSSDRPLDWPEDAKQLYARLLAHEFDDPASDFPFTERLARDNHWPLAYARRVVDEYRRFCFLACVEQEDVTPSDQIDQAWHLHLLYTRDYWGPFRDEVLRSTLHHGPTRGGKAERTRYDDQYTRTRHAYLRWFGAHPPVDIWPSATERFSRDVRWVRVNRDDHWLVPKRLPRPRPAALASPLAATVALALLLVGADAAAASDPRPRTLEEAGWDPYALAAGPFLWFYGLTCLGVIVAAAYSIRARSFRIGDGRGRGHQSADVYTTAVICGGEERALLTALTHLVDQGKLTVSNAGLVRAMDPPARDAHPLEIALYEEVARTGELDGEKLFDRSSTRPRLALRRLVAETEQKQLKLTRAELPRQEIWVALLAPASIAAPRLWAAMGTDRPVGFLVTMLIIATIAGPAIVHALRSTLTEGGRTLKATAHMRAKALERRKRTGLAGNDLLYGAAVLGGAFLTGTALADVRQAVPTGDGGSSSGGDGGDSGCGGGCGGCGG